MSGVEMCNVEVPQTDVVTEVKAQYKVSQETISVSFVVSCYL